MASYLAAIFLYLHERNNAVKVKFLILPMSKFYLSLFTFVYSVFNPIRPGGAQRLWWSNSQLLISNLLLYDVQTLWLLVFIVKTCSDQILAKSIDQGVTAALFSSRRPKIYKMKKFPSTWKLLKLTWGVNFGSRKTILDIKTFFKVKPVFRG